MRTILAALAALMIAVPAVAAPDGPANNGPIREERKVAQADARVADRQATYDAEPTTENANKLSHAQARAARRHASCGC